MIYHLRDQRPSILCKGGRQGTVQVLCSLVDVARRNRTQGPKLKGMIPFSGRSLNGGLGTLARLSK